MSNLITASCSCGKVQFSTDAEPEVEFTCHCTDCQRFTGSDSSTMAFFEKDACTIEGQLTPHSVDAASGNRVIRESCAYCGSSMFESTSGLPKLVGVLVGTMNEPFVPRPACHVWTKSRRPHVVIPDYVKQFEEGM